LYSADFVSAAHRADAGGKAERIFFEKLKKELPDGWTCEAGIVLERMGDIDFVVTSPKKRYFAIDLKSHRGAVKLAEDGDKLVRILDGKQAEFEKDVLKAVRRQAVVFGQTRGLHHVMPIIVFSKAKLLLSEVWVNKVLVVDEKSLVNELLKIEDCKTPDYLL
jgi:hypothetical protein